MYKTLKGKIFRLSEVSRSSAGLEEDFKTERLYDLIVEQVVSVMDAQVCTLGFLSRDGKKLILKAYYGLPEESELKSYIPVSRSIVGQVIREGKGCIVNNLVFERHYAEHVLVREKGMHSLISVPIEEGKEIIGTLSVYSAQTHAYRDDDLDVMSILAGRAAMAIENTKLLAQSRIHSLNTISVLANIIDAKDSYTRGHSEKVMRYALLIAEALGLSDKEKEIIQYASLLHDIGKIGVDLSVLKKPGPLTQKEWGQIYAHPRIGADIVDNTGLLNELVPVILHHHERFEGGGYPSPEKKTKTIPIGARILAVADAFEAMTSDRPYRKSLSMHEAKEELRHCAGTQFDPTVVDIFIKSFEDRNV